MIKKFNLFKRGNDIVSDIDVQFENGDIEFDSFNKNGHNIFDSKDYDDIGYRASQLLLFLRQHKWYVIKDGDKTDIIFQYSYIKYKSKVPFMQRGDNEYRFVYNHWYENGEVHGSKKEKYVSYHPFDKSFDNITIENIKPIIKKHDFHPGDRVKIRDTSQIGRVSNVVSNDFYGLDDGQLNIQVNNLINKMSIEANTNLPWWCNPIVVNFKSDSLNHFFHPDDLLKLPNILKNDEFDPWGEEDWDD